MTLCEHGCGTELDVSRSYIAGGREHFTSLRALLDEARRDLIETKEKRDRELHVTLELLRQRDTAEKRAVELRSKVVELERELEERDERAQSDAFDTDTQDRERPRETCRS